MVVGFAMIIPDDWFLLGKVERKELLRCKFLCRQYKVAFEIKATDGSKSEVWIEDPEAVYAIREEMWDHKWATHKDWLEQNKEYEMFDPIDIMESAMETSANSYIQTQRPVPVGFPKPYRRRK
jgi:hypothetical protein